MKALVIIPSVRLSANFGKYAENFARHNREPEILVIDEEPVHRKKITAQMEKHGGFQVEFFGREERAAWFRELELGDVESLVPQRAHNETSFGFLVALTGDYDMIVTVDDDTYPLDSVDFLGVHWHYLNEKLPVRMVRGKQWVNTHPDYFARGYPYCQRKASNLTSAVDKKKSQSVLNMGCWLGIPDLNAMDYLALNPTVSSNDVSSFDSNFIVAPGQFLPVCSMNLAFKPQIIPAFYQLWHKDRFDDIFSGLFLKKIADHLGCDISLGYPFVYHEKHQRDLFQDVKTELPAIWLNETLWKTLSEVQLTKQTWLECYRELASNLGSRYREGPFSDYIWQMTCKMLLWSETVEALKASRGET